MHKIIFLFLGLLIISGAFSQEISFINADGFYSIGTQSCRTAAITLCDMDSDGDLDALVANGRHWAEQNYLYYNDGHGGFKSARAIGDLLDASYKLQGADFNQDGYMDIAVANDSRIDNKLYFGRANGSFSNGISFGVPGPSRSMDIADIDGDGDIDIILSNRNAKNEILLNDGNGQFTERLFFGKDTDQTIHTIVIDVNGDQLLDLVTAERNDKNKIYLNRHGADFSKVILFGSIDDKTRSIDVGDIDNDGYLDIVTGNLNSANKIYFGDKGLTFEKEYSLQGERATASIRLSDLNNDGRLDIIEGNFEERNYVFLAQESGIFHQVGLREDLKDDTYHIEIGDLDHNGFPDIIESNSDSWNLFYKTRKN